MRTVLFQGYLDKGDCSDDNEDTNAVEPDADETFIPFFSRGIF